jgi:hypothetical protein
VQSIFSTTLAAALPLQAAEQPKNNGPVVSLSAFEVTAERIDFNKWIKVTSPNFVIYTDASIKETRLLAKQLEMTQQAVQFYFRRGLRKGPPLIVILPTTQSDWRKVKSTSTQWKPASVLLEESRSLVVLDDDWQESPGYLLAMVGTHSCDLMNIEGPMWFSTGLTSFFSTISFSGDSLKIGKEGPWSLAVAKLGFMDWNRFFKVDYKSPEFYTDSTQHERFVGQATAFIHYLLTNSDKTAVTKLLRWSSICEGKDKLTEQDFQSVFGENYEGMQRDIKKLQDGGSYTSDKISFPPQALKFEIQNEPASPKKMRELFVLAQAMVQQTPDSLDAIDSILKKGLKNEDLRDLLADSCLFRGRPSDALKQYRTLIDSGSTNAAVYEKAASIEMREAKVTNNLDHRLGAEQDQAEKWAKHAIELDPLFFDAYATLAWVHASGAEVKPSDVQLISEICHALSGRGPTDEPLAALAVAYWRSGDVKKAQKIDALLLDSPYTRRETRNIVEDLQKRLIQPTS